MQIKELYKIYLDHPDISNDTRRIQNGCIYWGIKGERFDGNAFTKDAFDKGAAFAVIDNPEYLINDRCILVEDSIAALQELARYHRQALGLPILAITGSNGKTTSKELCLRVLSAIMDCFATPGNLNNHIGLPLSLLQLKASHKAAIIELGANHQGENAFLCTICEPQLGLITNIGKDHLEGFGGMDGVEKANIELFDYLKTQKAIAFVNTDDERIIKHTNGLKQITYGTDTSNDIYGRITGRFPFLKAEIKITASGESVHINSHLFGSFHLYNLLAATAIGIHFQVPVKAIKEALESYIPQNNRSQLIKEGTNTYILDAYNANPSSMQGGISDFADYPAENKVLLLGDMFEMGEEAEAEHKTILNLIKWDAFKHVALAGEDFYAFKDEYPGQFFQSSAALKQWFTLQHFENTTFYLKGSRGMKMESIIEK